MNLALNKYGQVGRFVPGTGLDANVAIAYGGGKQGSAEISARSIQADQEYYAHLEAETKAHEQANRIANVIRQNAEKIESQRQRQEIVAFQNLARLNPMHEKLKHHYAKRAGMGESQIVADSLLRNPADFSSSGGNSAIVASETGKRAIAWRADFRQHLIVGNPLTRDGQYGPAITDYDRYVQGIDVNELDIVDLNSENKPDRLFSYISETTDRDYPNTGVQDYSNSVEDLPIAGGTMLGRYNGCMAPMGPSGMGQHPAPYHPGLKKGLPHIYSSNERRGIPNGLPGRFNSDQGMGRGMGACDWYDLLCIGQQAASQFVDTIPGQASAALVKLAQDEVNKIVAGGGSATANPDGSITVHRTGPPVVTSQTAMFGSVPSWVLYGGGAMVGLTLLAIIYSKVKS